MSSDDQDERTDESALDLGGTAITPVQTEPKTDAQLVDPGSEPTPAPRDPNEQSDGWWEEGSAVHAKEPADALGPHTNVQRPMSIDDEPRAAHMEEDPPIDDGWGSPPEPSGSTSSGAVALSAAHDRSAPERETGANARLAGATQLHASDDADADAPRLICIRGPDEGREFVLNRRDMSIGRSPDNDIVVNDPSVSRVHCRLLSQDGVVVATDQRSGNGTVVNGRRIERQTLASGHTLKLGATLFRFVEMGDVIKSTETSEHQAIEKHRALSFDTGRVRVPHSVGAKKKKRSAAEAASRYAILIVLAAMLVGGLILAVALRGRPSAKVDRQPADIAEEAFEAGRAALRAKAFEQAQEKLSLAAAAAPNDKRYRDELALLGRERAYMAAIDAAKELARSRRFADAMFRLDEAKETLFSADLVAARTAIRREHAEAVKRVADAASAEELIRASGDAFKDEPQMKALLQKADARSKKEPVRAVAPEKKPEPKNAAADEAKTGPGRTMAKEAQAALELFVAGKMESALASLGPATEEASVALRNKMLKFQAVFAEAREAVSDKRPDGVGAVKKALAFESKIAQGKSSYVAELRRLQADALSDEGTRCMSEQRYLEAYKAFKESLALAPDQAISKRKMQEIQATARDVFNQGYMSKDSDRNGAREKWARVTTMLPPEDEVHQKAKKWLEQTK